MHQQFLQDVIQGQVCVVVRAPSQWGSRRVVAAFHQVCGCEDILGSNCPCKRELPGKDVGWGVPNATRAPWP